MSPAAYERRSNRRVCAAQDRPGAVDLPPASDGLDVELKDVTFGYRDDQHILQVAGILASMRAAAGCA